MPFALHLTPHNPSPAVHLRNSLRKIIFCINTMPIFTCINKAVIEV